MASSGLIRRRRPAVEIVSSLVHRVISTVRSSQLATTEDRAGLWLLALLPDAAVDPLAQ
jgi:hypothetical protein